VLLCLVHLVHQFPLNACSPPTCCSRLTCDDCNDEVTIPRFTPCPVLVSCDIADERLIARPRLPGLPFPTSQLRPPRLQIVMMKIPCCIFQPAHRFCVIVMMRALFRALCFRVSPPSPVPLFAPPPRLVADAFLGMLNIDLLCLSLPFARPGPPSQDGGHFLSGSIGRGMQTLSSLAQERRAGLLNSKLHYCCLQTKGSQQGQKESGCCSQWNMVHR
jgi:hypothetical protein